MNVRKHELLAADLAESRKFHFADHESLAAWWLTWPEVIERGGSDGRFLGGVGW